MNTEHKDIKKIIPYGEQLRGFVNQKFISNAELSRILKERGVFTLSTERTLCHRYSKQYYYLQKNSKK